MNYRAILKENQELGAQLKAPFFDCALLGNIVMHQGLPVLEHNFRSAGIPARIQEGEFDNILQESQRLNELSLWLVFWDIAFIRLGLHHRILHQDPEVTGALLEQVKNELRLFFANGKGVPQILLNRFSSLPFNFHLSKRNELDHFVDELNCFLEAEKPSNVTLVDVDKVFAAVGLGQALDYRFFYSSKAPYTVEFYKAYADFILPLVLAQNGLSKKALFLDCDGTLWKGIVGEDGPDGIQMSQHDAQGAIFQEVQSLCLALKKEGVLLNINSKNNAEDVAEIFQKHPDMLLQEGDLACSKVNWEPKAQNLLEACGELNIFPDSVAFVDDSDMETAAMRKQLPQVEVLQVPKRLSDYPQLLRRLSRYFYRPHVSAEDQQKTELLQKEFQRQEQKNSLESLEDFIASLEIELTLHQNSQLSRVAQMTQKTNQFNLCTGRYSESEIQAFVDAGNRVFAVEAKDKFGAYGVIGACLVHCSTPKEGVIQEFLLSCRALGRGIESALLYGVLKCLAEDGLETVQASYRPSLKNQQCAQFFENEGFVKVSQTDELSSYGLALSPGPKMKEMLKINFN